MWRDDAEGRKLAGVMQSVDAGRSNGRAEKRKEGRVSVSTQHKQTFALGSNNNNNNSNNNIDSQCYVQAIAQQRQ